MSPIARLYALAREVARLRPPDHRDPEAFWLAKSELASQLRSIANDLAHIYGGDRLIGHPNKGTSS